MITNFIKEVKKFYEEVYHTSLESLTLEQLEGFQKKMQEFYSSDILTKNASEEERICNMLSYDILNFYPSFCQKNDESCKRNLLFLDSVLQALSENSSDSLKKVILKFYSDVAWVTSKTIQSRILVNNCIRRIIFESNLNTYNYLYSYGYNITKNHMQIVDYFNKLDDLKITEIAECTINSFIRGLNKMSKGGVDISNKNYICLFFPIGFEKVVKKIFTLLDGKFSVVLSLMDNSDFDKQLSYNLRYDYNFYLTDEYVKNYLACFEEQIKRHSEVLSKCAGAIYIESFGENRFIPKNGLEVFAKDANLAKLNSSFSSKYSVLYTKGIQKDTSFTIISYPCPEIGKDFEEIFDDTIAINTLDNDKYEKIQQNIIDVLDSSDSVHVTGKGVNKTDLTVCLAKLNDPTKESKFENCTADVNVPVGEVFTSPVLNGTTGTLHVSEIYLNGWKFVDLMLKIEDGFIKEYSCNNYSTKKENDEYINEHLLFDHPTLPMGEFAIGTNTLAYVMGNKYKINDKLDILIAEKTGPHFAFGDTCYSGEEDTKVFNPDGKEVIAKDNEISIKRDENSYFGCHTDITIPYYELGDIVAIGKEDIPIIQNGKFVLNGTEELNVEGM